MNKISLINLIIMSIVLSPFSVFADLKGWERTDMVTSDDWVEYAGELNLHWKKPDEALNAYDKAIQLDPKNINATLGKAFILDSQGRYTEALLLFDQALEIDPKNILAHVGKATVYGEMGKSQESQKEYNYLFNLEATLDQINSPILISDNYNQKKEIINNTSQNEFNENSSNNEKNVINYSTITDTITKNLESSENNKDTHIFNNSISNISLNTQENEILKQNSSILITTIPTSDSSQNQFIQGTTSDIDRNSYSVAIYVKFKDTLGDIFWHGPICPHSSPPYLSINSDGSWKTDIQYGSDYAAFLIPNGVVVPKVGYRSDNLPVVLDNYESNYLHNPKINESEIENNDDFSFTSGTNPILDKYIYTEKNFANCGIDIQNPCENDIVVVFTNPYDNTPNGIINVPSKSKKTIYLGADQYSVYYRANGLWYKFPQDYTLILGSNYKLNIDCQQ